MIINRLGQLLGEVLKMIKIKILKVQTRCKLEKNTESNHGLFSKLVNDR